MYNEKVKIKYLSECFSGTNTPIEQSRFKKSEFYENLIGKDISQMNKNEIQVMYEYMNFSSYPALLRYHYAYEKYTQWCIDKGFNDVEVNAYKLISNEELNKAISSFKKGSKYIPHDTINALVQELINPMDKAIILCLYNGIMGVGCQEIINLQKEHIHIATGTIQVPEVRDNKVVPGRIIKCDSYLLEIILEAMDSYVYTDLRNRNLEVVGTGLVKCFVNKKEEQDKANLSIYAQRRITERLKKFGNLYQISDLSTKTINTSGLIYKMKLIAEDQDISLMEVVSTAEFEELKRQFNIKMDNSNFKSNYRDYLS